MKHRQLARGIRRRSRQYLAHPLQSSTSAALREQTGQSAHHEAQGRAVRRSLALGGETARRRWSHRHRRLPRLGFLPAPGAPLQQQTGGQKPGDCVSHDGHETSAVFVLTASSTGSSSTTGSSSSTTSSSSSDGWPYVPSELATEASSSSSSCTQCADGWERARRARAKCTRNS